MSNKNTILVCSLCNEQYQAIDLYACSATYCPSIMCDKCVDKYYLFPCNMCDDRYCSDKCYDGFDCLICNRNHVCGRCAEDKCGLCRGRYCRDCRLDEHECCPKKKKN